MTATRVVRAAGGVVWRSGPEILVVHRPRYDDWTLPKGKLDLGEHPLAAAVRETFEESGVRAAPQVRLPTVRYLTAQPGVEKSVDYWSMRCLADEGHEPTDEVDALQWLPVPAARNLLTYAHDRNVLAAFTALPAVSGVVILIRHASAGRRDGWLGNDAERPLDHAGRRDAERAAQLLALFGPPRVISAPVLRCRETVAPVAALVGVPAAADARFGEDADVDAALDGLRALATEVPAAVVCSQGGLVRPLLARLREGPEPETPKGTGWVLSFTSGGGLVAADPLDLRDPAV